MNRQHGFSLVELMVALVAGLVVSTAVVAFTLSTMKSNGEYIQVIDLLYFKGYTHEEVAREFNIPLGTVKTRIRSAIIQLREKLAVN